MSGVAVADGGRLAALTEARAGVDARFFEAQAGRLARLCHRMAERFAGGGRLIALGGPPAARSDAHHVAVEFVHPVIVGKRALPAIAVADEGQLDLLAREADIVMAFGPSADLAAARRCGCLTIAFAPVGAEWEFEPPTEHPYVRQEVVETLYHVLWELVHVFFEHRGLLGGREPRRTHDAGASSFLYPFLDEREDDLERVLDDVRRSVVMKAHEIAELRRQTLTENAMGLLAGASILHETFEHAGTLLALGNGGSATDAMDAVADLRSRGGTAIDLTADAGIITAIANDIGTEVIFSRQVIAYGHPGDALLALSTSGNSANVIEALAEARRRNLATIAMVGYDGGRVAAQQLADHVVITRSEHIPRIQEAQASAYHVLVELGS